MANFKAYVVSHYPNLMVPISQLNAKRFLCLELKRHGLDIPQFDRIIIWPACKDPLPVKTDAPDPISVPI